MVRNDRSIQISEACTLLMKSLCTYFLCVRNIAHYFL